jgi:putative addiction module component (TIGR02574 family)
MAAECVVGDHLEGSDTLGSTIPSRGSVMARSVSEIENEIRSLARPEQERLLRALLEELDGVADPDTDRAWLEEVQRRSAAFDAGLMKSFPAAEVFERVRSRLKQ